MAFLFGLSTLMAGTIDARVSDSKYIEYGSKHRCVVKLQGRDNQKRNFYASAVIISPRWIITAAHLVENIEYAEIVHDNKTTKIKYICSHSDYKEDVFGKNDIAIGYLEDEVMLDFYPQLYKDNDEVSKVCSIAGYGITGTYQSKNRIMDQQKRAGSNIIDGTENHVLICSLNKGKKTSLEFLISNGDSGGGLFIDGKLAGINSCIFSTDGALDSNINDESAHTRISLFIEWIKTAMDTIENARENL